MMSAQIQVPEQLLSEFEPSSDVQGSLTLIAGDASDRKFYRYQHLNNSAICMSFPKWEGGYGGDPISWLGMHSALMEMGIPVPKVLHVDPEQLCIWTEDFGDNFLNFSLQDSTLDVNSDVSKQAVEYYKRALDLLVQAQYTKIEASFPAANLSFDHEKLMFEMNFFMTHFVEGFLGLTLGKEEKSALLNDFDKLCAYLDKRERVLCHRDYHVRNLMIIDNQVKWIDFQDARMGPHAYDVVSLVRDSYVKMGAETRHALYKHYFIGVNIAREDQKLKPLDWIDFKQELAVMGMQRNIKAIGSFGYLATRKGKPNYLCHVANTLETILDLDSLEPEGMSLNDHYPNIVGFLSSLKNGKLKQRLADEIKSFTSTIHELRRT